MILYLNEDNKVKAIGSSDMPGLRKVEVLDTPENPFLDWSEEKILCYVCHVVDGRITSYYPYMDNEIIEKFDSLGKKVKALKEEQLELKEKVSDLDEIVKNLLQQMLRT